MRVFKTSTSAVPTPATFCYHDFLCRVEIVEILRKQKTLEMAVWLWKIILKRIHVRLQNFNFCSTNTSHILLSRFFISRRNCVNPLRTENTGDRCVFMEDNIKTNPCASSNLHFLPCHLPFIKQEQGTITFKGLTPLWQYLVPFAKVTQPLIQSLENLL